MSMNFSALTCVVNYCNSNMIGSLLSVISICTLKIHSNKINYFPRLPNYHLIIYILEYNLEIWSITYIPLF